MYAARIMIQKKGRILVFDREGKDNLLMKNTNKGMSMIIIIVSMISDYR
ncbi:MAG: hypothetical protein WBZ20_08500 [Nitrososphaeraceae archaeon]